MKAVPTGFRQEFKLVQVPKVGSKRSFKFQEEEDSEEERLKDVRERKKMYQRKYYLKKKTQQEKPQENQSFSEADMSSDYGSESGEAELEDSELVDDTTKTYPPFPMSKFDDSGKEH